MNQQNMLKSTPDLPAKRKRGRPRKDENRPTLTPIAPAPPPAPPIAAQQPPQPPPPTTINTPTATNLNNVDRNMLGQSVTGVIDGIFDAGYLISIRVGPIGPVLRGVVLLDGQFCPITPANDVAPRVEMIRRSEITIPPSNPRPPTHAHICTPNAPCVKQPAPLALHVPMQNVQNAPVPMAESVPTNDHVSLQPLRAPAVVVPQASKIVHDVNQQMVQVHCGSAPPEPAASGATPCEHHEKQIKGQNLRLVPCAETVVPGDSIMEKLPSLEKDKMQQGEGSRVDVNEDPSQALVFDLSQSNVYGNEAN